MRRLIANENVNELLDKSLNQLEIIKQDYYIFLEQLNTLFNSYPDVYAEIEQTVKLPTQQDIEALVQMQQDLQSISDKLQNNLFADNYIETIEE